jgi:hypothetical protein
MTFIDMCERKILYYRPKGLFSVIQSAFESAKTEQTIRTSLLTLNMTRIHLHHATKA